MDMIKKKVKIANDSNLLKDEFGNIIDIDTATYKAEHDVEIVKGEIIPKDED